MKARSFDCIIIGYNEMPIERYENFLSKYGEESEAYRDLKFSLVELKGRKIDYLGLLNTVVDSVNGGGERANHINPFRSGDIPNLAAVYLTSYLKRRGFIAEYINLFQSEKEQLAEYLKDKPLCVAITTTFYVVNQPVNEVVEFIRNLNSDVKIIVGGPLIANHARNFRGEELKTALGDIGADIYVIEGAGESTLETIITCLKDAGDLKSVPNIAYLKNGELIRTGIVAENNSLEENAIDWRYFDDIRLGSTVQTRTARSCAFSCAFCNYPTRAGKLTLASVETVERELNSIHDLNRVSNLVFIDDTFNVPLARFKDLCRMMIRNKYNYNWFSYFRCSNADEEAFDLMAESGCKGVFLGIESGSPSILKNMNKAATVEKYADGITQLHKRGIFSFGSFIVGFPGETEATVNETLDFIKSTRPTYFRAQSWYCEAGTPIDSKRDQYSISGEGFVWRHATMDSLEAMDQIDRMFLNIDESIWLPQWSFDFWVIPYLIGRGISPQQFTQFMKPANKLTALGIAYVSEKQKNALEKEALLQLTEIIRSWNNIK